LPSTQRSLRITLMMSEMSSMTKLYLFKNKHNIIAPWDETLPGISSAVEKLRGWTYFKHEYSDNHSTCWVATDITALVFDNTPVGSPLRRRLVNYFCARNIAQEPHPKLCQAIQKSLWQKLWRRGPRLRWRRRATQARRNGTWTSNVLDMSRQEEAEIGLKGHQTSSPWTS
jgi:hypothetical protein